MRYFFTLASLCLFSCLTLPKAQAAAPDPKAASTKLHRAKPGFLGKVLGKKRRTESPYARAVRRNELFRTPPAGN